MARHFEWPGSRGTTVHHDAYHLGNDVAGTPDDHAIANAQAAFARDLVGVVQGGIGHGHAADKYRLQPRHGRQGTGATNLDIDCLDHGQHFLRRIFVRHRPAWLTRTET